jgi:cytochrome c551/c552
MRYVAVLGFLLFQLITVAGAQVSTEGQACLDCHSSSTPGIVDDGPGLHAVARLYEVAKTFYTEFIPEAEAILPGVSADVMNSPYHQWTKGLSKEQLQQQLDFYKKKYNQ